jgi:hypothetical protein
MRFPSWSTLKNALTVALVFQIPAVNANKKGNILDFSAPGTPDSPCVYAARFYLPEWYVPRGETEW